MSVLQDAKGIAAVTHPVKRPFQIHQTTLCISETLPYATKWNAPRAWIKSQNTWLRRKRWTGDVNRHLRSAPLRMVTVLYYRGPGSRDVNPRDQIQGAYCDVAQEENDGGS